MSAADARELARRVFTESFDRPGMVPVVIVHEADPRRSNEDNVREAIDAMRAFSSEYNRLVAESN